LLNTVHVLCHLICIYQYSRCYNLFLFWFLRQGTTIQSRLASNSPFSCLWPLSAGITSAYHHTCFVIYFVSKFSDPNDTMILSDIYYAILPSYIINGSSELLTLYTARHTLVIRAPRALLILLVLIQIW
jgi:hypothetical protein